MDIPGPHSTRHGQRELKRSPSHDAMQRQKDERRSRSPRSFGSTFATLPSTASSSPTTRRGQRLGPTRFTSMEDVLDDPDMEYKLRESFPKRPASPHPGESVLHLGSSASTSRQLNFSPSSISPPSAHPMKETLDDALHRVLSCSHHCRLKNEDITWALNVLNQKLKVHTIRDFSDLQLDSPSTKAHLLKNWPVNRFLSCLQRELITIYRSEESPLDMDVEAFLRMIPKLKSPAISAQITEQLKECHICNYDTLKSVPLEDLAAILGDDRYAQIIVKEIHQIQDFSIEKLQRKYDEIEFLANGIPLNTSIAITKMTRLHKLANKLRRHIYQTTYPMFKGRKEELEYLLEITEDYRNNLQVLCEHLSATTDVPSVRELETELLQVTEANRFDINEDLLSEVLRNYPKQTSRVVSFVGPTHSGKSTLICHMYPHMPQRPRVSQKGVFQPTTNNVNMYDDIMFLSTTTLKEQVSSKRILVLDVEGIDASPNTPAVMAKDIKKLSIRDIKQRLSNVNKLPRLCYTISNVIIYVDEANFARRSPFKHMLEFAQQSTTGVASSFPPSLLIVCNKCTINDLEMSVEETTRLYLETHDKNKLLGQAFLRVVCVYIPDKGTEKNYFRFLQQINVLKLHLELLLQEQEQIRQQHNSNLNRAQWGDKFRWIVYNFHQELKVTPYEVSLKIGPQYKLESVIVDFFHSIYDDKPSEGRWDHYKQACEASIKLLAMMTVAANNEALLSQFLPEMNKVVDGMLTSAAYEEGKEGEEPMPSLSLSGLLRTRATSKSPDPFDSKDATGSLLRNLYTALISPSTSSSPYRGVDKVRSEAIGHLTPPASPATQSILDHQKTKQVEFEEHKLYRSLVGFIWQRFHEVGPCSAKRPECVDGDGMPIYCTQVRNGHISHRSQTDIWVSEASNLPFYPRVMWAKARRQFGKMFYRKMASQLNVWDGPFQEYADEAELESHLCELFIKEHAAYNKLQYQPLDFFSRLLLLVESVSPRVLNSEVCFICQTNQCRGRLMFCGHPFCQYCIEKLVKLNARCPICKKRVEATVNFQLLSTSEEEYLALNVRRFIAHFRDNPDFAKPVTVISVIGRHTREQAADLYKISDIRESAAGPERWPGKELTHPLAILFFCLEQNGAQFMYKGDTNRSAVYFLEGFVLVHYNINYDPKRISNSLPHPLYFARSTSDALVFVETNGKELLENNLLSQFWRGRFKEFLLPPRQSVLGWAILLSTMYEYSRREKADPATAVVPASNREQLLNTAMVDAYKGEAYHAVQKLVRLIKSQHYFNSAVHLEESSNRLLMASLWKYVVAESFVHYLGEFCVAWGVEPTAVSDVLGTLLDGCNQQVRDQFLTLSYEPDESPAARKKKSHQRMKSNSFRYEEFALWCADILESTERAVSLTHLTAYLDRFAHDKVAHAREGDATGGGGDSDDFDTGSGDTGGKQRKQLQQRGSRRRRESREKLERERKKQLATSSAAATAGEGDRKEHHDVGGVAGSGDESGATADQRVVAARRMKLSSMFPVYGHLVNLRDLKRDIGADEVENLFSVLCYRPYHPATTLPSVSTSPPMFFASTSNLPQVMEEEHKKRRSEQMRDRSQSMGNMKQPTAAATPTPMPTPAKATPTPRKSSSPTRCASPTSPREAALASGFSNAGELVCVLCLSSKTIRLQLCGHPICAVCCRSLSRLEHFLEDDVCEWRVAQRARERRERERERKEAAGPTTAWRGASWSSSPVPTSPMTSSSSPTSPGSTPTSATSTSAPTTPVSGRSDAVGDLYKVGAYGERVRQMERERERDREARERVRDKGKEKEEDAFIDGAAGEKETLVRANGGGDEHYFAKTIDETVKLFCCPICHRWDIVRVHRYIAVTIKRPDAAEALALMLAPLYQDIKKGRAYLHRPLEKLECANPAVGNIRVGNWRGKAVAVKYYAGWSPQEFRSELAAMVLTSGCKQIVKVLGAHAPEDYLPRHDNPFQIVRPFYPRTLEKVLWSGEEVNFLRGLQVLKDVAKAIRYLHVLGFIHKNVKPGNVVVQELRGRRKEKALLVGMSFGSAASLVSSPSAATKASAQRYKAPEVTKGGAPTKASDIYGFGKTIRKTLVKVFYNSNAAMEDWHSIELPEVCPYHIRQLIDSCADPEPSKRPRIEVILEALSSEIRLQSEECINIPEETFGEGDGDEWQPIVGDLLLPELDTVKNYLLWPVYREEDDTDESDQEDNNLAFSINMDDEDLSAGLQDVKLDLSESDADDSDLVDTARIKRRTSLLSREDLDKRPQGWQCSAEDFHRMLADERGPFVDVLHYYRQAFARRYSTSRHSNSALSAAVSDVKLFIKFLLDFLVNLADDLSFFEMKEAVAGEVIFPLLHDILFERIKANHTHKNNFISKKMASFQHLTLEDLGAPEEWRLKGVSQPYAPQIEALKQLPRLSSPYLKARLLQEVFDDVVAEADQYHRGKVKLVAGFDDTIAVIQYLLLKAQIPHIYSEYYFMDVFLEETTNDELALRFVLGKLGGFIQMMFEDNMEVPIGSVKDALIEAVAERECPEDTALIASIFSHIAEVVDKDHSPCLVPRKIREELQKALVAERQRPARTSPMMSTTFSPGLPRRFGPMAANNIGRVFQGGANEIVIGSKSREATMTPGHGGGSMTAGGNGAQKRAEDREAKSEEEEIEEEEDEVVAPTWVGPVLSIVGVVLYKRKFHFRKQYSLVLYNELKWQLRDLQEEQTKQKERERKRRAGGTAMTIPAAPSSESSSGSSATSSSLPSLFQGRD